ncbi:PIN domain-containing protein [Leptospira sp. 85282-16]|uniref:PIN domain-containing protein n=1 Tax=Leptospira sp. 85282-16 TaxID=2971256 RepID=UPI0021BF6A7D|nr:PIN domain-containing protein [Leptospira sp. 85282-16]MCT8335872.1 PIN domain-containing protein [Leptospira sp. 85282-16]
MKHIIIDTSEFTRLQFDFNNLAITKLKDYIDHGVISIYSNSVINGEVLNQITEKSNSIKNDLNKLKKENPILRQISEKNFNKKFDYISSFDFLNNLKEQYNSFLFNYKVKSIEIEKLSIAEIFNDYFNHTPPFGNSSNRKSEFPDAVILKSAELLHNTVNDKIILISGDKSFKDFCENSKNFILYDRLENLLSSLTLELDKEKGKALKFISTLNKNKKQLELDIEKSFDELVFELEDEDGEVNSVSTVLVDIEEINIIEVVHNNGIFLMRVNIEYYANVSYTDYENSIYDSEEGDYLYTNEIEEDIYSTDIIDIELNVEFNKSGTKIIRTKTEKMDDVSIYIRRYDY